MVGGFLRDTLLGRPTVDVDLAVEGDALSLTRALVDGLGGSYVPLDTERGVARALVPVGGGARVVVDVATMQGDIHADLARRDFTVNAMAVPLGRFLQRGWRRHLLDPWGGLADLERRRVRALGEEVFPQDPCRLLRAVRLAATLGFQVDEATLEAMRRHAALVVNVAAERQREEFLRLLAAPQACPWLYVMDDVGLLCALVPELEEGRGVAQPREHYWDVLRHNIETVGAAERLLSRDGLSQEVLEEVPWDEEVARYFGEQVSDGHTRGTLLKVACLLHDVAKPASRSVEPSGRVRFFGHHTMGAETAQAILRRLHMSGRGVELVRLMVEHHLRPNQMAQPEEMPTQRAVYRYFRDLGEAAVGTLFLSMADHLAARGPLLEFTNWRAHARIIGYVLSTGFAPTTGKPGRPAVRVLTGHDLMSELGLEPGPGLGRLLEALNEAQAAGEVSTRAEALALARHILARGPNDRRSE
ncbi:MAG: CCA tRNA nucleotidyltransferase [Chloroflexi bacterium]|nr:CCA tRNA nucleotidyltransferase [Chloroflexota bacterium]